MRRNHGNTFFLYYWCYIQYFYESGITSGIFAHFGVFLHSISSDRPQYSNRHQQPESSYLIDNYNFFVG